MESAAIDVDGGGWGAEDCFGDSGLAAAAQGDGGNRVGCVAADIEMGGVDGAGVLDEQ